MVKCIRRLRLSQIRKEMRIRSWTSGTGAGGCEWEAQPARRSSVLSSRKVVLLDQLDGLAQSAGSAESQLNSAGRSVWVLGSWTRSEPQSSFLVDPRWQWAKGSVDQSTGLCKGSKLNLGLLWGGYRRWDVNGTCCIHSPNKLYTFGLGG
ncbi:hypothetical protein IGI04_025608 [Brassica rapa subsp. trilocularis]|uniref:Uncharacterized protein n=1 Tax=Brassica rapa subsp. trilocularis TaxID=1813537 RepID=A0ABQ7KXH5_BRACM|nr:hypothetical protein IGI04_025608 [Brassica rapa subsp. trilocularis]